MAANSTEPPPQLIFGWTVPLLVWLLLLGLELFLVGTAGVSAEIFVSVVALVGLVEVLLMLVVGELVLGEGVEVARVVVGVVVVVAVVGDVSGVVGEGAGGGSP